jgi:hypothetical protein
MREDGKGRSGINDLIVGHCVDAPGRAGVIDQAAEVGGQGAFGPQQAIGGEGQGLLAPQAQTEAAHHAVGVRGDGAEPLLPGALLKEFIGGDENAPGETGVLGHLKGHAQDDIAGLAEGLGQEFVVLRIAGVGEQDVKDDETRPRGL